MSEDLEPRDADRARAELLVGKTVLDRYRILELIAIGGMGSVYRGEHIRMRKRVAIKVLHPEMAGLPELVDRFEREAVAGAHIQHPNVASASDFGQFEDGSYYVVLEYVQGITVHELISRGPVPMVRAVEIARQVAMGLAAGHARGVIHRDVKPRNIMVSSSKEKDGLDEVKLIDYGFARVPLERLSITDITDVESMSITRSGMAFGTIAYMAPEIAAGMEHIDQRSDLYALGIVFYEMLAGKHPFDGIAPGELFLQQRNEPPPPIRLRTPGVQVAQSVESVVMRLLKKAPEDRYQSADAFITALDATVPKDAGQLGLIPWTSQLKGVSDSKPPAEGLALPPPLPQVPYEPRMMSNKSTKGGWSPSTLVLLGIAVVITCVILVMWLRGFRATPADTKPEPTTADSAVEVEILVTPPPPKSARPAPPPPAPSASAEEVSDAGADDAPDASLTIDGLGPAEWRTRLGNAFSNKEWREGADAILALAEIDPKAFEEESVIIATAAIGVRLEFGAPEKAREVFDTLGLELEGPGLDILYEMVSGYAGSEGADRALTYLRRPDLMKRASPALQVVVELREVACPQKAKLFDRGANLGDERTLALLDGWRSTRCLPAQGHCCFHEDPALDAAIKKLSARLKK